MPTTDKLKQTIESNNLTIGILNEKAEALIATAKEKKAELNAELFQLFKGINVIPEKILNHACEAFIRYDSITLRWKDFDREGYTNNLDISIEDQFRYSGKEGVLPSWKFELSCSSSRVTIMHNPEKQDSLERYYYNMLSNNITTLLLESVNFRNQLIDFIERSSKINVEADKVVSAMDKLKSENKTAEGLIERNEIIAIIKPHGETSMHYRFGVDIDMFTYTNHGQPDSYRYGKARWKNHYFDAINLVKETKKYIEVDFIRYFKGKDDKQKEYVTRSVQGRCRLTFEGIISILSSNKSESDRKTARNKQIEESSKKAVA